METLIGTLLGSVAVAIIGWIAASINKWANAQKEKTAVEQADLAWKQVVSAIEIGVAKTEKDFVELAKSAAKDGKLSKDERQQAEEIAKKNALEVAIIAAPAAAQLLLKLSADAISGIIKAVLGKNKK